MKNIIRSNFFTFLIVGGINTAFNYGIYALFVYVGMGHIVAATCSFVVGMIFNFKTHAKYVFKTRNRNSFYLYVASWVAIYCVNVSVLDLLVRSGVNSYLAGALLIPPMAILAFLVLRFIVFKPTAVAD